MESRIPEGPAEDLQESQQLDEAQENLERMREIALQQAREADRLIREYPFQSLGLAAALGLLVGLLITRK
jgi:ElaB/YqjD/DUF883 family membrane-anchored ribosome-binding protein